MWEKGKEGEKKEGSFLLLFIWNVRGMYYLQSSKGKSSFPLDDLEEIPKSSEL